MVQMVVAQEAFDLGADLGGVDRDPGAGAQHHLGFARGQCAAAADDHPLVADVEKDRQVIHCVSSAL